MRPDRSVAGTGLQSRSPLRLAVHPRGDSLQRATRSPRLGQQRDEAVPRLLGRLCKASAATTAEWSGLWHFQITKRHHWRHICSANHADFLRPGIVRSPPFSRPRLRRLWALTLLPRRFAETPTTRRRPSPALCRAENTVVARWARFDEIRTQAPAAARTFELVRQEKSRVFES